MEEQKELIREIKKLTVGVDNLSHRYNTLNLFFGGMLRGMGLIVGATLLVMVGTTVLSILGVIPAFSDFAEIIRESFEKARLQ